MFRFKYLKKYLPAGILFFLLAAVNIAGQTEDSSYVKDINPDSVSVTDSLGIKDSAAAMRESDIDAIVYSTSEDSLHFNILKKEMSVYGKGELKYKNTSLKSGRIKLNFITNYCEAEGVPDTSASDPEIRVDTPVLSEDNEVYEGYRLNYNFKTQRGYISLAKNKQDGQRYEGTKVKKVSKDTYFIEDGIFTTCESDTPHTHFTASEMKVVNKEQIVARWIFMHVGGVPVPIPLPFGVFPNNSGRRSGIIPPGYSVSSGEFAKGQSFTNFGYFWAASDYFDYAITSDFYSRGSFGLHNRIRYVKRYSFSGNIQADYSDIKIGRIGESNYSRSKDWNLRLSHSQIFNPTTHLDANLSFSSSNYTSLNSYNYNELLNRVASSSATLRKSWDGASLSISYGRTQYLDNGNINETLPNINFSKSHTYPFRSSKSSTTKQSWYDLIGFNYNGQFLNQRNKKDGDLSIRGGVRHTVSINASPKIGYFSISPSFNYEEKWYNKKIERYYEYNPIIDPNGVQTGKEAVLVTKDIKEINFVRTFNFNISANTKIYGMMSPNMLGIEAFRHTIIPTVSYNYRPDFGEKKWGYFSSYTDSSGREIEYDQYGNEVFGGAGRGESQSINFNISNIFEMKTMKNPNDTSSQSQKIPLLNLSAGLGYNFAADSLKLSNLQVSYRTNIGEWLNIDARSSYTFYKYVNGNPVNKFLSSEGKGLMRMTNFNLNLSSTISGEKFSQKSRSESKDSLDEEDALIRDSDYAGMYGEDPADFSIPWDISMGYNYNLNKANPLRVLRSSNINVNLSLNFTKSWKLRFQTSYDFEDKRISAPRISIFKDLHCWEMNFSWNPLGKYSGFRFELRMKAPQLKDIKVTKSSGQFTSGGY